MANSTGGSTPSNNPLATGGAKGTNTDRTVQLFMQRPRGSYHYLHKPIATNFKVISADQVPQA